MRTLFLVRHAKSSWDEPGLKDRLRPLNKRGKSDALLMANLLYGRNEIPELIVSSTAKRAFSTAKRMAKTFGFSTDSIELNDNLYMANETDFFKIIWNTPDNINNLMIISHNPGITEFANMLSGSKIENIPTCGIVRIDYDLSGWSLISMQNGKLIYFDYPKNHKPMDPDTI